jgi:pyruvate formate lyase activating enzyme
MLINGLQKLTLLDYPGRTACTVFTGGCNYRCPYCHNAPLVLNPYKQPVITEDEVITFLKKRGRLLDGVCISGWRNLP